MYQNIKTENTEHKIELPFKNWPQQGSITFIDVKLQYRPNLPVVLKGITCQIKAKEKIGVIGRTGAGKSKRFISEIKQNDKSL